MHNDFNVFQTLMLVLTVTGLLLGAVTTERRTTALILREQQIELARVSAYGSAGAMGMALAHELSQPLSTVADLPACRAAVVAVRRRQRAGDGCSEQGGG